MSIAQDAADNPPERRNPVSRKTGPSNDDERETTQGVRVKAGGAAVRFRSDLGGVAMAAMKPHVTERSFLVNNNEKNNDLSSLQLITARLLRISVRTEVLLNRFEVRPHTAYAAKAVGPAKARALYWLRLCKRTALAGARADELAWRSSPVNCPLSGSRIRKSR